MNGRRGYRERGSVQGLVTAMAIPLALGSVATLISAGQIRAFPSLEHPPLTPAWWVFPVVWTILYLMIGTASYLVYLWQGPDQRMRRAKRRAISLYAGQLAASLLWPILFFRLGWHYLAFAVLLVLWGLIAATIVQARVVSMRAGALFVPYLLWIAFAGYLNLGVALLN